MTDRQQEAAALGGSLLDQLRSRVAGTSWTHLMARPLVRPLIGGPVTPNHLTTLRLLTGLAACAAFAVGERSWEIAGGFVWLLSAFLDRADGELARLGGKTTPWGHRYDFACDAAVASLFFLAIGIGLRESWLGGWSIALGLLAGAGVLAAEVLAERIDRHQKASGERAFPGFAGFDFDDILYLFGPVVWLDWHLAFLLGATAGAPAFAIVTWRRWRAVERAGRAAG